MYTVGTNRLGELKIHEQQGEQVETLWQINILRTITKRQFNT
jgi:hypothetical protein